MAARCSGSPSPSWRSPRSSSCRTPASSAARGPASAGSARSRRASTYTAVSLRGTAVALVLASKPASAWSLAAPLVLDAGYPDLVCSTGILLVAGSVPVVLLHIVLAHPRFREAPAPALEAA